MGRGPAGSRRGRLGLVEREACRGHAGPGEEAAWQARTSTRAGRGQHRLDPMASTGLARCRGSRQGDLALASPGDGRQRAELGKAATEATNWRRCSGGSAAWRGERSTRAFVSSFDAGGWEDASLQLKQRHRRRRRRGRLDPSKRLRGRVVLAGGKAVTGRPLAAEGGSIGCVKTGSRGAKVRRERQGGYLQRCLNLEQRTRFGGVPTRQGTNRGGRPWRPGWGRGGPRGRGAQGSGGRWLDSGDAGLMKSSGARAPCEGLGQARHGLLREREREVTERCEAREEEERKRKGMGAREEEGPRSNRDLGSDWMRVRPLFTTSWSGGWFHWMEEETEEKGIREDLDGDLIFGGGEEE